MKLMYTPASPFARKARIVARERGLMDRIEEIVVTPYQDDARLLAVNPAGLVPALVLDDDTALLDSPLVCQYLDAIAPGTPLIPADVAARWPVLRAVALADALMDFAVAAIHETRHDDAPASQSFIARHLDKVRRCVAALEVTADTCAPLSMADVATACALGYLDFRYPDLDWRAARPDLDAWHAAIEARPAFRDTRPVENPA